MRTKDGSLVELRRATEVDEPPRRALYAQRCAAAGLDEGFVDIQWRARLSGYDALGSGYYVIEAADGVVGELVQATGRLVDIYVDESQRRRGIAAAVLDRLLSDADGDVRLTVARDNTAAINLYRSRGFEVEGGDELNVAMVWHL